MMNKYVFGIIGKFLFVHFIGTENDRGTGGHVIAAIAVGRGYKTGKRLFRQLAHTFAKVFLVTCCGFGTALPHFIIHVFHYHPVGPFLLFYGFGGPCLL